MKKYKLEKSKVHWINDYPSHWSIDRIKDVCESIDGGGTPKSSIYEYWEDGQIIWVTPTDFSNNKTNKYITNSEKKITELGMSKSSAKIIPAGSVIMSSRASIGEPKINSVELTTNQGFISFTTGPKLKSDFLYYIIKGYLGEYYSMVAMGTTFMEMSRTKAKQVEIPIPPIEEQIKISQYLDDIYNKVNEISIIKFGKVASVDDVKSANGSQHFLLIEYLKNLTYECVTGKKQVAEIHQPNQKAVKL